MFIVKKNELIEKIQNLKKLLTETENSGLININENLISKITDFEKEISEDLTFNVLCLGDFSSGKSTFINQFFIGGNPLPTNVTTTTAKLTVIKYGETNKIVIKYKDGSVREHNENFESILNETVSKNGKEVEKIDYVEVYIDSNILKEGVIIIDSPGLNDPETERMNVTFNYIEKADSVLYLLTAMQAWKKSEKEFLEEKILRKEDLDKVFFLLNYWDMVEENQRETVLEFVKGEINKSLKIASAELGKELMLPPLIPISAKTKENFPYLKEQLWDYLGSKKEAEILESKYSKLNVLKNNIIEFLKEKIEIQKQEKTELDDNIEKLKQEKLLYEEKVNEFKNEIKNEISEIVSNWIDEICEFQETIAKNINQKINQKINNVTSEEDLEKLIKDSVQKTIHIEKEIINYKNKKFIKKINKLMEEKKAELKLEKYFIKNEIIDLDKLGSEINISPDINYDYKTDILVSGVSILVAGILTTIASPLALIGIFGLGYGEVVVKPREFKKTVTKMLPDIEEEIYNIVNEKNTKIRNKEDDIIELIINQINSDIVKAYQEKVNVYNEALQNKDNNKDDEVIDKLNGTIEELSNL